MTLRRADDRRYRNHRNHPEMLDLASETPNDSLPMSPSPQISEPQTRSTAVLLVVPVNNGQRFFGNEADTWRAPGPSPTSQKSTAPHWSTVKCVDDDG